MKKSVSYFSALLIVFILTEFNLTSCNSCLGDLPPNEQNYYTIIKLADTSNRFEEISYIDIDEHYFAGTSTSLDSFEFTWDLRISKPRTTVLIRTKSRGWDTLEYSMERRNVVYIEETKCEPGKISMDIIGPTILSHSFDTVYFTDIVTGSSYSSTVFRTLFIK